MKKFKCSICGYVFDESKGQSDNKILPGTKWQYIPSDYKCPLCGAPKSAFEEIKPKNTFTVIKDTDIKPLKDFEDFTPGELSALFSNLSKGCEKQQLKDASDLFKQLTDYFNNKVAFNKDKSFTDVKTLLENDLSESYDQSFSHAYSNSDRGALRALVWSEKVSKMLKALIEKYFEEKDEILEDSNIYVCDICGFVYLGNKLPEVCPVCKVPNFKISKIERN